MESNFLDKGQEAPCDKTREKSGLEPTAPKSLTDRKHRALSTQPKPNQQNALCQSHAQNIDQVFAWRRALLHESIFIVKKLLAPARAERLEKNEGASCIVSIQVVQTKRSEISLAGCQKRPFNTPLDTPESERARREELHNNGVLSLSFLSLFRSFEDKRHLNKTL